MERYDDDEVEEILRRAAEQREGLEHEDLVAAAKEAGIDPNAVERAAEAVRAERELREESREAATTPATASPRAVALFKRHLLTFAIVNAFLLAIDILTPGAWWFFWPLLSWGVFVALQGARLLVPLAEDDKPKSRRERRRALAEAREREREQQRQAKREASKARLANAETAFEDAVQRGLASVMEQVTGGLENLTRQKPRKGEFGEFVKQQEGGTESAARGASVRSSAPGVRVDSADADEPEEAAIEGVTAPKREREA